MSGTGSDLDEVIDAVGAANADTWGVDWAAVVDVPVVAAAGTPVEQLPPPDLLDIGGDGAADAVMWTLSDGWTVTGYDSDGDTVIDQLCWQQGDRAPSLVIAKEEGGYRLADPGAERTVLLDDATVARDYPELASMLPVLGGMTVSGEPVDAVDLPVDGAPGGDDSADPDQYSDDWFLQAWNGTCSPAAVAVIASEYTGRHITDLDLIDLITSLGAWSEADEDGTRGMYAEDAARVLEALGIPATATQGDLDDLRAALAADEGVMVVVDADEIWDQVDDDEAEGRPRADHMVTVAGIEDGYVVLSDSGTQDGDQERIPIAVFMDAWQDSGYTMVRCDESAEEWRAGQEAAGPGAPTSPDVVDLPSAAPQQDDERWTELQTDEPDPFDEVGKVVRHGGWVLLPMVLSGVCLIAARRRNH